MYLTRCSRSLQRAPLEVPAVFSRTAFVFTSTTRRRCGSTIRAIASVFDIASIATSSVATGLRANSSSVCGSVATRPAERI